MEYLVIDLQKSALDKDISTLTLLRKAFVVAKKLRIQEFEKWINCELNGYDNNEEIPKYREVLGEIKGLNPYKGWIPVLIEDRELEEKICSKSVGEAISKLEYLMDNNENSLCITFQGDFEKKIGELVGVPTKYNLFVDKSQFKGILEAVTTIILNWALELEADGILGEELIFTSQEREIAVERNYTVNNFYGNISDSQIQQNTRDSNQS